MKTQFMLSLLAGLAAASPVVEKRQLIGDGGLGGSEDGGGLGDGLLSGGGSLLGGSDNDLRDSGCNDIIFIFARASTEPGLMGMSVGPSTCSGLQDEFSGRVACQGVGPEYTAGLMDNFRLQGTSDVAIEEATGLFTQAHTECPESQVVAGGYSQGTAVMHATISELPPEVQEQIKGVVLYGDTRNEQDDEQIPNFPPEKTKIFCATGDMVCSGSLMITMSHFMYGGDVDEAVDFLSQQLT